MNEPKRLMQNLRMLAQANKFNRLLLLRLLYAEGVGKKCLIALNFLNAPKRDEIDLLEAVSYLEKEGFLIIATENREGLPAARYLRLTHKGILEVERSIDGLTEAKEHVTPTTIQYFHDCSVQTGHHSSSISTQTIGANAAEVLRLIGQPRKHFPPKERRVALEVVDALKEEIKCDNPRSGKLKALLSKLGYFAIKPSAEELVAMVAKIVRYILQQ
jgi:hypothetical protein